MFNNLHITGKDFSRRTMKTNHFATLAQIGAMALQNEYVIFPVDGDCLEGAGVPDGGFVAVCFTRFPRPPKFKGNSGRLERQDICLCWLDYAGRSYLAVKAFDGIWGGWQMVATHYAHQSGRLNRSIQAGRIFGVVFMCWDRTGRVIWQHDLNDFPTELGTTPTIHFDNAGDPIAIKGGHTYDNLDNT